MREERFIVPIRGQLVHDSQNLTSRCYAGARIRRIGKDRAKQLIREGKARWCQKCCADWR